MHLNTLAKIIAACWALSAAVSAAPQLVDGTRYLAADINRRCGGCGPPPGLKQPDLDTELSPEPAPAEHSRRFVCDAECMGAIGQIPAQPQPTSGVDYSMYPPKRPSQLEMCYMMSECRDALKTPGAFNLFKYFRLPVLPPLAPTGTVADVAEAASTQRLFTRVRETSTETTEAYIAVTMAA